MRVAEIVERKMSSATLSPSAFFRGSALLADDSSAAAKPRNKIQREREVGVGIERHLDQEG